MHTMVEIERRLTQVINGQKNHSKTRAAMTPKDKTPATTPTTVTVSTYNNNDMSIIIIILISRCQGYSRVIAV